MNIVPKKTIYFNQLENGFINQLIGENYWAVPDNGKDAYFDTITEAEKYIKTQAQARAVSLGI